MKTSADHVIDGDLAALRDASRHALGGIDASLHTTGVYRDDRPGAEAKRNSLADVRRRELALMPLTLSHTYAHRVARATAGAAAILCSLGLLVVLDDRLLMRMAAVFIPGFAIGMYAMISIAFVLCAYVVATWIAEYKFAVRMRELVSKGGDIYSDLDQLAVGPFAVAAEKVRRLDQLSITLPLAGIALLVPLLGFVGFIGALSFGMPNHYGRTIEMFTAMASEIGPVILALGGGVTLAILVGRACAREHRASVVAPDSVRILGHWSMLIVALVVGAMVLVGMMVCGFRMANAHHPPSNEARMALALGGEIAIMLPVTWLLLWWRRRERARLGD